MATHSGQTRWAQQAASPLVEGSAAARWRSSPGRAAGEFLGVPAAELGELRGVMPVPRAELMGRRHVLGPLVQPGRVLADPARPEPVHQNARSVLGSRGVI